MNQVPEARPDPDRRPYLGMRGGDLDGRWYAKYWDPEMAPLPEHIRAALDIGPQATALCLGVDDAGTLSDPGYQDLESGYSVHDDGSIHIATLTRMPGVTPAMWDWWFWSTTCAG